MRYIIMALILTSLSGIADARSSWQVTKFKRLNVCPSTAKFGGKCPGYVVDHVIPLCAGGVDKPFNMQWQTIADAKLKDRDERRMCRK